MLNLDLMRQTRVYQEGEEEGKEGQRKEIISDVPDT